MEMSSKLNPRAAKLGPDEPVGDEQPPPFEPGSLPSLRGTDSNVNMAMTTFKRMSQYMVKKAIFQSKRPIIQKIPWFLLTIPFVTILYLGGGILKAEAIDELSNNPFLGPPKWVLLYLGAFYGPSVRINAEYYRHFLPSAD